MIRVLYAGGAERAEDWTGPLARAFDAAGLDVDLSADPPPEEVDVIVYAPNPEMSDFTPYVNARAVLSLWAGVETIVTNETLTQPLARMVDPGLTEGMVEYVCAHVLRHHLGLDGHIGAREWRPEPPPLARSRRVGVLGLGALGAACAAALAELHFEVTGWARSPKEIAGVRCLSGGDGFAETLATSEILVLLLPLTSETEDLIGAAALARLPEGAILLNPARGALVVEADLLAALESGRLSHATLDTFRTEPLPGDHPFWTHPGVTVTPHIASATRPETAATVIAENTRRAMAGEPLLHLVDRDAGY